MKGMQVLGLVLAISLAILPSSVHGATFRQYTSRNFHFRIEYPASWKRAHSAALRYESFNKSKSIAVTVNYHASHNVSIRSFTPELLTQLHKSKIHTGAPRYSRNIATFTGSGTIAGYKESLSGFIMVNSRGAYSILLIAPRKQLSRIYPIFMRMVHSFKST